jgi:membrane protein YdbS with pleckstrin-like domain
VPYPKKLLNDGEEIALDLRPHWWFFSKHIATGIPLFIVVTLILANTSKGTEKTLFAIWAIFAIAWAGWLVLKYFEWNFTHFVVTSDRVIYRTGVLSKHGVEIPMERINNINFHQGMFERIIGAGDLDIESAGRDGQSHFDDVWHPDGVQQELYRQMESNAKKRASWGNPVPMSAPATGAPAPPSVPEQLQQLADLRDKGVITVAEFETKKAQLLERM